MPATPGKGSRVGAIILLDAWTYTSIVSSRGGNLLTAEGKQRIARAVARAVPDGCSLLLNIGTTTEAVARELLHHRGLRVITELVINHTSDQHDWFKRARRSDPNSSARNWYVWSDTDQKYPDTRIIFTDTEKSNWTWDPEAHAYYWHRFFSHQPDLNFENPRVVRSVIQVMKRWVDAGVDGFILVDLPPEEADELKPHAAAHGLDFEKIAAGARGGRARAHRKHAGQRGDGDGARLRRRVRRLHALHHQVGGGQDQISR